MRTSLSILTLSLSAAAAFTSGAMAQDYTRTPAFGTIELEAGFLPDPYHRNLTAGGSIEAQDRFTNCRGYIAQAPDFSLYYTSGGQDLYITVDSDADTTLVINGPDTSWYCDDDGADEPLNPLLYFENPQSGRYDIWVGTYSPGTGVPATLFISELGEYTRDSANVSSSSSGGRITANTGDRPGGSSSDVQIFETAIYGEFTLSGGFLPDPHRVSLMAGGSISANQAISSECYGSVTSAPSVELNFDGTGDLFIYTSGDTDTTLAINRPDGTWVCDDDSAEGLNAGLTFRGETSGIYDIYVGTFGGGTSSTTLNISEIALDY